MMKASRSGRRLPLIRIGGMLAAMMLPALTPQPAQAQLFGWLGYGSIESDEAIPPQAVSRRLARQGYRLTGPLRRNGAVLLADVTDFRGQPMRLVLDASDGAILQRFLKAPPAPRSAYNANPPYPAGPSYAPNSNYTPPAPAIVRPPSDPERTVHRPVKPKVARIPAPQSETRDKVSPATAPARPEPAPSAAQAPAAVSQPNTASAQPAPVAAPPAPQPSAPARRPAAPARNSDGPGYANGVPINPLD